MEDAEIDGDGRIISWFQSNTYNPQASDHIDAICDAVLADLVTASEVIADAARNGEIVFERNYGLGGPRFIGGVDLVVGPPVMEQGQEQLTGTRPVISEGDISDVWLAVNFESLISSVGKNWKNRGREIHSHYLSVYEQYPTAVTASLMLLNTADLPDGPEHILDAYREFEFAHGSLAQRLDSLAILPLSQDEDGSFVEADGVITSDDTLSYKSVVQTIVQGVEQRHQGDVEISEATLHALLSYDESDRLEFKRQAKGNQDIAKEAVALANNEGGRILYGVTNTGDVIGLPNIDDDENRIAHVLEDSIDPSVVDRIERHTIDGADIVEVKVRRMKQIPASYNGIFYLRTGTTTSKLTGHEIIRRFPRE